MILFKLTDKKIFKKLGKSAYLRNGVGFGFISDDYLYDNCFLEIGFGRITSDRGDWGGGFEYATTTPLKVTVDKNLIIQKVETDSYHNNESRNIERITKRLLKKLKVGSKLCIRDTEFEKHLNAILEFIPCKAHIGHDVFEFPHMLKSYTEPTNKEYYNFRDPSNYLQKV